MTTQDTPTPEQHAAFVAWLNSPDCPVDSSQCSDGDLEIMAYAWQAAIAHDLQRRMGALGQRAEPVGYFQNVNSANGLPPQYEQVSASAKGDDDVFPLYAALQPAEHPVLRFMSEILAALRFPNVNVSLVEDIEAALDMPSQPADRTDHFPDVTKMVPSDEELIAFGGEEQFFLFCDEDEFLQIARALLARYGAPVVNQQLTTEGAPVAAQEPVAWFTEDHQTDKSATTWDATVAQRWRVKGWPVSDLYTAPQPPTSTQPSSGDNAWRELFWEVAKILKCLPSTFVDVNDHVLNAARKLVAQPSVPNGWRLIAVNERWDDFVTALAMSAESGMLPPLVGETWNALDFASQPTPPADGQAQQDAELLDAATFQGNGNKAKRRIKALQVDRSSEMQRNQVDESANLQSRAQQDADKVGVERMEWMACESRRPWVTNSLKHRIKELRDAEKRSRNAFKKDYMGEPARYFADACGEAAALFESRLSAIDAARAKQGGQS